jgi:hypothetical protein
LAQERRCLKGKKMWERAFKKKWAWTSWENARLSIVLKKQGKRKEKEKI